jgi:hypothetical protein
MALTYLGNANFNGAVMNLTGDGINTVLVIDFTKAPFAVDFAGNLPTDFAPQLGTVFTSSGEDDSYSATFSFTGTVATITLNKPLPDGVSVPVNFSFAYGSL